jgi:hypothetical protein
MCVTADGSGLLCCVYFVTVELDLALSTVAEFIDPDWGDKDNSDNPMPELTSSPSHGFKGTQE